MIGRSILTVVILCLWGGFNAIWSQMLPQLRGISGAQALNNDSVVDNAFSLAFRTGGDWVGAIAFLVMVLLLLVIWWPVLLPVVKNISSSSLALMLSVALVALVATLGCNTNRAVNESERNQSPDVVEIQPNQTAFQIPAIGGNFSQQAQFESVEYLLDKKVPSKRVILDKTNQGSRWVTNNIIILVTRTPVARQWTKSPTTGTEVGDQSLCAESKESIEVCFQIAMSAVVQERDSATYLYYYPTTKLKDPQLSSVYEATPLDYIVDNQVRQYLQAYIGEALTVRSLDDIITQKAEIVREGSALTTSYFARQGITISYMGLGGELVLAPGIQDVINRRYIAEKEKEISTKLGEAYEEYQRLRGEADAAAIAKINNALGGNAVAVGPALEGYRWDGSRVLVRQSPDSSVGVTQDGTVVPVVRSR